MQVCIECVGRLYSGFDAGVPHEREELNNDQCVRGPALTKPEKKKFRGKRDSGRSHGREISLVYFSGRAEGGGLGCFCLLAVTYFLGQHRPCVAEMEQLLQEHDSVGAAAGTPALRRRGEPGRSRPHY